MRSLDHTRTPTLPPWVARLVGRLPMWPPSRLLALVLNQVVRPHLAEDVIPAIEGRPLRVEVHDMGLRLDVVWQRGAFRPAAGGQSCDLVMRASAWDFGRLLLRREDPDTLFFARRLCIEGDTELGLHVKNTLDALPVDALLSPALPAPVRQWLARHLLHTTP